VSQDEVGVVAPRVEEASASNCTPIVDNGAYNGTEKET
jgi:hypothetical protein